MLLKEKYFSLIFHKTMKESNNDYIYKFMKLDLVFVKRSMLHLRCNSDYFYNDHYNRKVKRGILEMLDKDS